MFAVFESGGKQHTVSEGDQLKVELLPGEEGASIEFDKVLMISDGSASKLGNPFVENAKVTAKLVGHGKSKKVKIFKMKRRKDYRRTYGHRQNFTEILIESISS
jgi:large subunit ribosomal protein L21